jgi:FMN phosphatase YigB (HAD superfamily)
VTRYTWVFDLDNTLHDAQIQVFLHLHRNMTSYLQVQLSLDEAFANALRRWQRYGTVLIAAIRHHGTDPRHFLLTSHQFPDLDSMVTGAGGLRGLLRRLPGRKLVFSNSSSTTPAQGCALSRFPIFLTKPSPSRHPLPAQVRCLWFFAAHAEGEARSAAPDHGRRLAGKLERPSSA